MGRIKYIELSEEERQALEHEYRVGKTHSYRQRCKGVLLKSEKRTSAEVAEQLDRTGKASRGPLPLAARWA